MRGKNLRLKQKIHPETAKTELVEEEEERYGWAEDQEMIKTWVLIHFNIHSLREPKIDIKSNGKEKSLKKAWEVRMGKSIKENTHGVIKKVFEFAFH